jgi:hypothetical protein
VPFILRGAESLYEIRSGLSLGENLIRKVSLELFLEAVEQLHALETSQAEFALK